MLFSHLDPVIYQKLIANAQEVKARKGHFFKPQMLVTQFATLEAPGSDEPDVLEVDITHSLDEVVAATVATIRDAISQG